MSDIVSPLQKRKSLGNVQIHDAGPVGMISLRGDQSSSKFKSVCGAVTGANFPAQGQVAMAGDGAICWMSPDEVLLIMPLGQVEEALAKIDKALAKRHFMATDVSHARAMMRVEGPFAREVIAKLAPVDLHPDSYPVGQIVRTRLGQVAAAFWMTDDRTFSVICFRSVAEYSFDLLAASAKAGPVGHFRSGT